jgi:UDP-N-acetylmuramate: L-alanyl-gamma-D-glutamyl-meso-diaminopimelate ligase
VGNLEFDHADIYADFEAIRSAVRRFVTLVPSQGLLILGADSAGAVDMTHGAPCRVTTFGLGETAEWRATALEPFSAGTTFTVEHRGTPVTDLRVPLVGEFNVRNVLAAFVVASEVGLDATTIAASVARFDGVKRRLEIRGRERGVTVYDDFAHHPTAVRETLAGVRAANPSRRLWALFEPRSATACRRVFQDDFAEAFRQADEVIIGRVYRSTLPDANRLSETELVAGIAATGVRARHVPEVEGIVRIVAGEAREGDLVVVMSNGAFGGIHDRILKALAAEKVGTLAPPRGVLGAAPSK